MPINRQNPYESPQQPEPIRPLSYPRPDRRIAWRMRLPGVPLLIVGSLQLAPLFVFVLGLIGETMKWVQSGGRWFHFDFEWFPFLPHYYRFRPVTSAASLLLIATVTLMIVCGAWYMIKLRNYRLCLMAAVLATIPLLSPLWFGGIPFGLWAIWVLLLPGTRNEFQRVSRPLNPE